MRLYRRYLQLVVVGTFAAFSCVMVVVTYNCGPVPLFVVIGLAVYLSRKAHQSSGRMGTARLANFIDLQLSGLFDRSGVLLGKTLATALPNFEERITALFYLASHKDAVAIFEAKRKPMYLRLPETFGVHSAIIAPTGSGKSAGYAIPNLLIDRCSAIVFDYKAELLRETAIARMEMGQRVVCIAPFGLPTGFDFPISRFNPLQLCDPNSRFFLDDAGSIANSLIIRQPNEHQPYFNDAGELVVKAVLAALLIESAAEECTLTELRRITSLPGKLEQLTQLMLNQPSKHAGLMQQLAGQLMSFVDKTRSDVLSTIHTHLNWIDSIAMAESLSETTFQPGSLFDADQGMTIYFHIPVNRIATYRGYIRTVFTSLSNYIFQQGESRDRRIRFYLDESYGLGSRLNSLYDALIYGRSFGMRLNFYFQALSQIEEVFTGNKAKDFRSNVAMTYAGIADYETAQQVSAWIGRQTVEVLSRQNGANAGVSFSFQDRGGRSVSRSYGVSFSRSTQEQSRELLQPEEILQLSRRTSIITLPHIAPILAEPVFYFEHPTLSQLARRSRELILGVTAKPNWIHRLFWRAKPVGNLPHGETHRLQKPPSEVSKDKHASR